MTVMAARQAAPSVQPADLALVTPQTTPQNTSMTFKIGASATEEWLVKMWLLFTAANATMDVRVALALPAGATVKWATLGLASEVASWGTRGTGNPPLVIATEANQIPLSSVAGTFGIALVANVFGGGTAGTATLQFAQQTADAGALSILKGSVIEPPLLLAA